MVKRVPPKAGRRGAYKKAAPKPEPAQWRRTFLAQWREFRDMTQPELAEAAKVSIGTVSGVESGGAGYSAESLHKLSVALGITKGMLLDVNPNTDPALWALLANATETEREQIAKLAAAIVTSKKAVKR